MALIKGVYDLKAFQEAYALILELAPFSDAMPQVEQFNGIAGQIRRASTSICANLAEGFGKNKSKADLRKYIRISLGSAEEMDFWIKLSMDKNFIPVEIGENFRERYKLVCRLLGGFEKSITDELKNQKTQKTNELSNTRHQTLNTGH